MTSRRLLFLASFVLLLMWSGQPGCFGQDVVGYTAVLKSTNSSEIDGYSKTETSYAVANYYDAGVIGYLFDGSSQVAAQPATGYVRAEAYLGTSSVHQGDTYTLYSEHYLIAYYTSGSGFYNPYEYYPGTYFAPGEGYPPGYSFSPGGGPEVVQEQDIYLGYTYLQFSTAPPHVSSVTPGLVVRGTSGAFTLQGSHLQDDFGIFTVRALDSDSLSVASSSQTTASLSYTIAANVPEGNHRFTVSNTWGESEPVSFTILSVPPSPPLLPPLDPCAVTSSPQVGFTSVVPSGNPGGSGAMTISFSGAAFAGISPNVTYGPSSTPSSIAANIAALITSKYLQYGLNAKAFGPNIVFGGTTTLGNVTVTSGPSFTTGTSSNAANATALACYAAPAPQYRCLGLFPSYDAVHVYTEEGITETPREHITRKHIFGPPTLNPKNTVYVADGGSRPAFRLIQAYNFLTVLYDPFHTRGPYIHTFRKNSYVMGGVITDHIGVDASGNELSTNNLYLSPDRCTVITSFPSQ